MIRAQDPAIVRMRIRSLRFVMEYLQEKLALMESKDYPQAFIFPDRKSITRALKIALVAWAEDPRRKSWKRTRRS